MHIPSTITAAGLAFVLSFPAAAIGAPADPEVWARVNSAGAHLHGRLDAKGDKLTLTKEGGELHELDPAAIVSIDFESLRPADEAEPLRDGALRSPWKTATVGKLPRAGTAKVKDGRISIETSSAEQGAPFGSFFTAYRPLPKGDAHFTARVARLESYEKGTRVGIMLRDGEGIGAKSVFLAVSHRGPATMAYWDDPKQWTGSASGDAPVYSSPLITAKTPGRSVKVDVDIAGAKELYLVAQDGGDGIISDWADWAEPRITVNGVEERLTALNWISATTSFGAVSKDKNAAGGELKIDGKTMPYGIGTHANSMVVFRLPPGATRFRARCGIDDGGGVHKASIQFMVFTQRPRASLSNIRPDGAGLRMHRDVSEGSRPGHWLRLVRKGGRITGYESGDAKSWRELWSVEDKLKPSAFAGVVAQGKGSHARWKSAFDDVAAGAVEDLGSLRILEPEIALVDGTVFHEKIETASDTLLRLGGDNKGFVIPAISVARIVFTGSLDKDATEMYDGRRQGLLLTNGDFFEGEFVAIEANSITVRSPLFGDRTFGLDGEIIALILRPVSASPIARLRQPYTLETRHGGRLFGKAIRIEGGQLAIDTVRLRTQRIPLTAIRRLTKQVEAEGE